MIHKDTVDQTLNFWTDQIQKRLISTTLNPLVHVRLEATRNAGATVERQGSPLGCKKTCGRKQGDENCWDKAYVHRVFVGSRVPWWSFYLKVTIQVHHGVTSPQRRFRCFANELKKLKSKVSMTCSSKYLYTNSSQTSERYLRDATWCHLMLDVFASEKWWMTPKCRCWEAAVPGTITTINGLGGPIVEREVPIFNVRIFTVWEMLDACLGVHDGSWLTVCAVDPLPNVHSYGILLNMY